MWKRLGTKLEHLEIRGRFDLVSVAQLCPNISRLAFDSRGMERDTEDMCKSYGASLLGLKLSNCVIGNAVLTRISTACPNAIINYIEDKNCGMLSDRVLALGRTAASWQVSSRDADFDDSLFYRVGMLCVNLQRCSVTSYANSVSVNSFRDLFLLPKPKLKRVDLHVTKPSCAYMVLAVLIDKACLLNEFSYKGPCPPLEIHERVMVSQTELEKVIFAGGRQCMCQDRAENSEPRELRVTAPNMGMFCVAILGALMKNRSLAEIVCRCSNTPQPHRLNEVFEACDVARTRRISVLVCGWRYL